MIAGRVPLMFGSAANVLPHVQAGTLKALAATQVKRLAIAPDVPTMIEAGLPGYDAVVWMGLLAPAGTPRETVMKLSQAVNEALRVKEVETALQTQGFETIGGSPEDFGRHIAAELKKWADVAIGGRIAEVKPVTAWRECAAPTDCHAPRKRGIQ